ncbi:hypothetical protein QOZ80_1BG0063100 [Eleusine coracana subsp. coracana]|nr:hypothetical protein QOZ80_1BG0063100 [Eleusine coracana subsp. coracana]
MAGSFTRPLIITALLAVHLFAGKTFARHAPAGSGSSAPSVRVLYTAPTTPGPSPSNGHKKQQSTGEVLDGVLNGAHGVSTVMKNRTASCTSTCDHTTTMGSDTPGHANQLNPAGNGGEVSDGRT